ncbi:hypothetical protein MMC08_004629 [Hypocenomyce scalaris]|nr:hypothetical protein [Hypocenomyce scalaris]
MASTQLPSTMKAQVLRAFNSPYSLSTMPTPSAPSGRDILVKVAAASYCHTDAVAASRRHEPRATHRALPRIRRHSRSGGARRGGHRTRGQHQSRGVRRGSRAGVPAVRALLGVPTQRGEDEAGYGAYCAGAGNLGISPRRGIPGVRGGGRAGSGASLVGATAVGVMGCGGGLGHLALQFAALMGLRVVGVDNQDAALRLARGLKTWAAIYDARETEPERIVTGMEGAEGVPVAERGLDAVLVLPESQRAFDYAMRLLRHHSLCVVVSFPADGFKFSAHDLVFRDIKIVRSLTGRNRTLREMLEFASEHGVRAVTMTFPLHRLNTLVEGYHKAQGGKLVVDLTLDGGAEEKAV